jgi:hypothetical protein
MQNETAVTTTRHFCRTDSKPLFCVNAGIPVEQALEQASDLLAGMETLVLNLGAVNEDVERNTLQVLTEMTRALVDACQPQDREFLAQGLRMAKAAKQANTKPVNAAA